MSARTPIILFVVAALLLTYVLLFERGRPGATEVESRAGFLLDTVVPDRITSVQITSGAQRIALARRGEGFDETWTLEEPKHAPVDPDVIENYLRSWEFAIPVRTLQSPTPEDLKRFGLDTPKGEVTFEMGPAKVRVSLGAGSPVDAGGYLRIDDRQQLIVVGKDVVALFDRTAAAFELKGDAGAPDLSDLDRTSRDASVSSP